MQNLYHRNELVEKKNNIRGIQKHRKLNGVYVLYRTEWIWICELKQWDMHPHERLLNSTRAEMRKRWKQWGLTGITQTHAEKQTTAWQHTEEVSDKWQALSDERRNVTREFCNSPCFKATFHYSSQLQTWLQTWFSTRFAARFSTISCGFATCFRHFLSNTWSRTCCINLDMSRLMQQVRWFVRVLDKWNVEKTRFKPANEPVEAGFLLRILLFVHDVIKWKNAMKKLDFTPQNVINCVDNEPALWDTEFTDVHPEITAHINSYHWLSFLEA